jgi:peptide/nickel transport system ATP-binding protein
VDTVYNIAQHPYTQELLKAFPDLTHPEKRLVSIPGYPPRLDDLPSGCRFAPRCPVASALGQSADPKNRHIFEQCQSEVPEIYQLGERHFVSCHLAKTPSR